MGNNLHVSYDLIDPGKNYDAVIKKIKELGDWAKVNYSYWYVDSKLSSLEAANAIWSVMDRNDKLYVVDSTNNTAHWQNLPKEVQDYIQQHWIK